MTRTSGLVLATATSWLALAAPAWAQSDPAQVPVPAQDVASAARSGAGEEQGSAAPDASDIVVTARRVAERLQDVPISITVFNQQQIANRNIVTGSDLALYTPSLQTTGPFGGDNVSYAIRGFTQENRTTPSVAVYFADVVAPRSGGSTGGGDGAGPGFFYDLQNVQVLKGPQGTLFGRNTTGGAVLLVPQKPTSKFEGYVEGLYGSHDWKGLQGVINVPLGERARGRIAVDFQDRDGLTKDVGTGLRLEDRHYIAARGSLVVDLTPNLENYTIVNYTHSNNNGAAASIYACNPASFVGSLICGPGAVPQAAGPHLASTDLPNPRTEIWQWGIINTTTWQASDDITIKNIASYAQVKADVVTDIFGTNIKVPAVFNVPVTSATGALLGIQPTPTGALAGTRIQFIDVFTAPNTHTNDQETITEELQLQGRSGDKLTWQAGAYYEDSNTLSLGGTQSTQLANCSNITALQCYSPLGQIFRQGYALFYSRLLGVPAQFTDPGFDFPIGGTGTRRTAIYYKNRGVYAQATYALTEQLKLTGGIRYTWDKVRGISQAFT